MSLEWMIFEVAAQQMGMSGWDALCTLILFAWLAAIVVTIVRLDKGV